MTTLRNLQARLEAGTSPLERLMTFTVPQSLANELPRVLNSLGRIPLVRRVVSTVVIEALANATSPRPRALSMADDYTSWKSLTDRTFSGRHLPPFRPLQGELPSEETVNDLQRRRKDEDGNDVEIKSTDTSVMFMFFAQWFTDSFLRTSRDDFRKNTSNQEIDLCQIYGLTEEQTHLLRSHEGGRLKSQQLHGEEYPEYLFEPRSQGPLVFKPEFKGLHDYEFITEVILKNVPDDRKDSFFAVGLEHGNSTIGNTIMNVVFLREHNRIAGVLRDAHPEWEDRPEGADSRLFETTRNIMIVLLLKLVVEEYIRHISPYDFPLELVPFVADGRRWNRSNWVSIEFNLLYRWHSLVPSSIGSGADRLKSTDFRNNNPLVISRGIEPLIAQCSRERAGKIGLMNTPYFLVDRDPAHPDRPSVEERTIALMRKAELASFNDYRESFGLGRIKNFDQLTKDADIRDSLEKLYGDIDKLEWYVGIFAEDYSRDEMMGRLMTIMVAYDAFTQALTNPLLARNVFNEATFTKTGMDIIGETKTLEQIIARNSRHPEKIYCNFRC